MTQGKTHGNMHHHFSRIAHRYRDLRATDPEPVAFIAGELSGLPQVEAADIGCGAGRYDLLLFRHLGNRLRLTCIDANADMLRSLKKYLRGHCIGRFTTVNAIADNLPVASGTLNCILTFNAVHHFNVAGFLQESARVLKAGGHIFIYTRTEEQNRRNIWGRYFPGFCEKETRLHKLRHLRETLDAAPSLVVQSVEYFSFRRVSTLERLVEVARASHYSTLQLYSPQEMERAIAGFQHNVKQDYSDPDHVEWVDENTLFVILRDG